MGLGGQDPRLTACSPHFHYPGHFLGGKHKRLELLLGPVPLPPTMQPIACNARNPEGEAVWGSRGGGEHRAGCEMSHHRVALPGGSQNMNHIFPAHGSQGIL